MASNRKPRHTHSTSVRWDARDPRDVVEFGHVVLPTDFPNELRMQLTNCARAFVALANGTAAHAEWLGRDPLTGLTVRRIGEGQIASELARAERASSPLSLVFADVDGLRAANNSHGHEVGDQILSTVGRVVRRIARKSDLAIRWAGDELVVALPDTNIDGARRFARSLRRAAARASVKHEEKSIPITLSIGVALSEPSDTAESLVRRADAAMFAAKSAGRNRVVVDIHDRRPA